MGAGASFENDGKIYKPMECGCIFACEYYDRIVDKLKLVKCCYTCMESLKRKEYNICRVVALSKQTNGKNVDELIEPKRDAKWLTTVEAMQMAHTKGIRSMEEFLQNTNILDRYM